MNLVIYSPLSIQIAKTARAKNQKFTLNLNTYSNSRWSRTNAKKRYTALMWAQVEQLPLMQRAQLTMQLFKKTKGRTDRSNVLSIHEKFFCDCLSIGDPYRVEYNGKVIKTRYDYKLPDDCDEYLAPTIYLDTKIDRKNPRVEITVTPL